MAIAIKSPEGISLDGEVLTGFTKVLEDSGLDTEKAQGIADYLPNVIKSNLPKAPEKYGDFKLKEGTKLDAALTEQYRGVAKELNLSQEGAQRLVDFAVEQGGRFKTESDEAYKKQLGEWKTESTKLLGDGENLSRNNALIAKVREAFFSPELVKFLGDYGFGDHPEMVKLTLKIGEKLAESNVADGGSGGSDNKDAATVLFGQKK